jgi:aminopeptidase N
VVGATGVQTGETQNPDGTKTVAFHAEDVHDFAWTADPHYKVVDSEFNGSVGPVKIRLLTYQGHKSSWERYISIMQQTMRRFDDWYGPYPYAQITVLDPPHGAEEAGGMEYPTFITGDTVWWAFKGERLFPEGVTEHEFGHQYWYGMVATNEFENAWLDEGINSYTEAKVLDDIYGRDTSVIDFLGAQIGEPALQREQYLSRPDFDSLARPSYTDMSFGSYGAISYGKTATMLLTLENVVGEKTLREAVHNYFMKYRFAHPTQEDFLRTVNETAQQDLSWYWQQAVYGTQMLDYEVSRAESSPVNWWDDKLVEKEGETEYETQIVLHRKGDFVFPVEAEIKFDNGETDRVRWDGRDRWVRYVYTKKAKVVSVQIDPDYRVTMDRNYLNNSETDPMQHRAVAKLTTYWTFFTQFLGQILGWLT